ncbi:unnamed protein product [Heterosigma akashiwo]
METMSFVDVQYEEEDDVNIAQFHPQSGRGYIYGTKQGRVKVVKCRNYDDDQSLCSLYY